MNSKSAATVACAILILSGAAVAARGAAEASKPPYPDMLPLEQYLMPDRNTEISLARTAAPAEISAHATVLVLTRHGFEEAVKGGNGFTCLVERAWTSPINKPGFWNPKNRSPICYNPPAVRSILPYTLKRTELVLARRSKEQIKEEILAIVSRKELPTPEPGAMSYMMSKDGYLADEVGHWHPHLMFHIPKTDAASWGANVQGSPVVFDPGDLPEPETIFMVPVGTWSDGTSAAH